MLRKFRERMESEKGFTLIELLVVILIIGILAAIALPAFLSQREKGQDAEAKSDARNIASAVESCYAETQNYNQCPETQTDVATSGVDLSRITITPVAGDTDSYTIEATSDSGNTFRLVKTNGASPTRPCTGDGGCGTDNEW